MPRVFVDDSGRIHLLWGQTAPGGVFSERVRHATSADGGASWSTPHDFIFGDHTPFHWWTAAMDRCGAVHLVIRSVNEELQGFNVRYARWQGGWDDARVIFRESDLRNVTLGVRADGTAVELVGSLRVALDADPIPTYAVVAAELRIGDASH